MSLPTTAQVKDFKLASINPQSVTGRQVAAYGIVTRPDGSVRFTIDRTSFGTDFTRQVQRGEVHEWTLTSRNRVGPVSHPFHIHVNPFEIFSMLDPQGVEHLDRDPVTQEVLPLWRDTVILHEGWKVSFRTAYRDFDGVFVNHCHILDHEDQGMMELVEIVPPPGAPATPGLPGLGRSLRPYPAPDWDLVTATGTPSRFSALPARPRLLVFFEGFGCLRCNGQIQDLAARYAEFQRLGLEIVAVSSDAPAKLQGALAAPPAAPFLHPGRWRPDGFPLLRLLLGGALARRFPRGCSRSGSVAKSLRSTL